MLEHARRFESKSLNQSVFYEHVYATLNGDIVFVSHISGLQMLLLSILMSIITISFSEIAIPTTSYKSQLPVVMAARSSLFFSSAGVLLSVISVLTAANLLYPTSTILITLAVIDLLAGNIVRKIADNFLISGKFQAHSSLAL